MNNNIVQKLWNFCNTLRDDGMFMGDYLEQLTYLLFLKMADERSIKIPDGVDEQSNRFPCHWQSLLAKDGQELETHYNRVLNALARQEGILGKIFLGARNKFQNPAKLRRVIVDLIDKENWSGIDVDVKGSAYEGLLEKYAEDTKSGAGQYFTPRALIRAMVDVMQPMSNMRICDPACGTGGFFLCAYEYIQKRHRYLIRDEIQFLRRSAFTGWEIVQDTLRLCVMNLYLHGLESTIHRDDSLRSHPGQYFDMVLTNPPFGRKSSDTYVNDEGRIVRETETYTRQDFWATTSNKQLNFVQHIYTILDIGGRAAVVVPDNVLFEGGAGEKIRRKLLETCDVHTLLRLPTGIFYKQGVKANVLFFDKRPASDKPWTKELWIYDCRTNQNFSRVKNPLRREHLDDFVRCCNSDNRHERLETERFRRFTYDELISRDNCDLDIFWLKDESLEDTTNLPEPDELARECVEHLQAALDEFNEVLAALGAEAEVSA